MKKVKIVQRFFSKSESANAKSFQIAQAKSQNLKIAKVEIIDAYELYRNNGWLKNNPFKKLGLPSPDQFMVIVHYKNEIETNPKQIKQSKVLGAKKAVSMKSKTKIVKMKVSIDFKASQINSLLNIVRVSKRKVAKRIKREKPHIFYTYRPNASYRIAA